ncbi:MULTISPECIES: hypothetical protein [unclassified Rhizobium]|uniref:hypothetical protein n=1 Tax=unclassified Rhizobium TaxID=2613769 RepID=UPI001FDA6225|nr:MULTISPECIES: hypothetical protein [unclassified Rhizobium]
MRFTLFANRGRRFRDLPRYRSMQQINRHWQIAAQNAISYRAKFALATEIVKCDASSREIRRAARRVVRALEAVIDLPIASADVLRKGRQHFDALTELLASAGLDVDAGAGLTEDIPPAIRKALLDASVEANAARHIGDRHSSEGRLPALSAHRR